MSYGLSVVIWLQALLMLAVPFAVTRVPPLAARAETAAVTRAGLAALLRLPVFRRVVLVAALILGSHAMHDTFSVIRWRAAGVSPQTIGVLWSLSVAAEVVVFFVLGPWLLRRLTPAGAVALAATAGAARWLVAAFTTDIVALSLIQPLHGVTFALLHLACMRMLAQSVPDALAATAQAVYHGRRGRGDGPPYTCLRMALCPLGSGSLWHHECVVPRGLAGRAVIETGARCHVPLTRPASR